MGCGKSTLGRRLSEHLNLQFVDMDHYIEERNYKTIPQIFAEEGEAEFRKKERKALEELSEFTDIVIATGGGAPCFFDNVELMNKYEPGYSSAENEIELLQKRKILSAFDRDPIKISAETLNLSPVEINNIKKSLQSDGERKVNAEIISKIANNKTRNKLILEKLFDLNSKGIKTIFFACNVAHAKLINAALRLNNIDSGLILGETTSDFRRKQIDGFKDDSSSLNILVNVSVLTTGFDSPNIDCVFISRPVTSIILYSQMIGRGIRGPRMGGNECCKLIEVVDNLDFGDESWAFNFFDSYWSL